jgi:hypothetical protein
MRIGHVRYFVQILFLIQIKLECPFYVYLCPKFTVLSSSHTTLCCHSQQPYTSRSFIHIGVMYHLSQYESDQLIMFNKRHILLRVNINHMSCFHLTLTPAPTSFVFHVLAQPSSPSHHRSRRRCQLDAQCSPHHHHPTSPHYHHVQPHRRHCEHNCTCLALVGLAVLCHCL